MKTLPPVDATKCDFDANAKPVLLWIAPLRLMPSGNDLNFDSSRFRIVTVHDAGDIYLLSGAITISYALLSDEIGETALRASAEAVRWQWPGTRILILGTAGGLDDHLYDETVRHDSDADILFDKFVNLTKRPFHSVK